MKPRKPNPVGMWIVDNIGKIILALCAIGLVWNGFFPVTPHFTDTTQPNPPSTLTQIQQDRIPGSGEANWVALSEDGVQVEQANACTTGEPAICADFPAILGAPDYTSPGHSRAVTTQLWWLPETSDHPVQFCAEDNPQAHRCTELATTNPDAIHETYTITTVSSRAEAMALANALDPGACNPDELDPADVTVGTVDAVAGTLLTAECEGQITTVQVAFRAAPDDSGRFMVAVATATTRGAPLYSEAFFKSFAWSNGMTS